MTEGPLNRHDKPMCVRVWLEVGHACEPRRSASGRSLALDWRVWVRGSRGTDISPFVHKVVFHLHPASAFVYPKRVLQEPPYEIQESGCASIDIPIHVYLKCSNKPKKICLRYSLHIENNNKTSSESRSVYYDFENPTEPLYTALMKGGGEVISRTHNWKKRHNKLYVLFEGDYKSKDYMKTRKFKYIEPVRCKHSTMRTTKYIIEDICPKCGDSINTDFKKQLRSVAMTEEEIERVSHLYLSFSSYEKSVNALTLPPFTDPIYAVPELPTYLSRPY
ncbi:protein AF-9-like [Epargyreus clarus]|uniref:protein AF-9-like n=1 Tax=Epargyreus clarus TaxID=520877 RepID=UPI003C2B043A